MASKTDAPIAHRVAKQLQIEHARHGGVHMGAAGGGCPVCALLREARAEGILTGPWPSIIAWDGTVLNQP